MFIGSCLKPTVLEQNTVMKESVTDRKQSFGEEKL